MKIFTKHIDHKPVFEKLLHDYSNLDFSLFSDCPPASNEYSSLNIMHLLEPNEYFGMHDWTIKNKDLFQLILTWDDRVLNNCPQAMYVPFGSTWLQPDQYQKEHKKEFWVSHLSGKLKLSYGHSLRHELLARQNEIKPSIDKKFFETYGSRDIIDQARIGKEEVFANSMYNVAIENFSHRGYFTEKLIDCFLFKSMPIYWGCSNVGDYFNIDGIYQVDNVDDIIEFINIKSNHENLYGSNQEAIEDNYQRALQYLSFEQMVVNKILEVFKHNNLI